MSKAYVLINVERDLDITSRLKKIPEVKEVYRIYGIYDMIVKVETKDMKDKRSKINNDFGSGELDEL